jgi:hypothetical protein
MKEPTEECPRGQAEPLIVEGPEDHRLDLVLQGEILAVAALPPRDRLLRDEAACLHVLEVLFFQGARRPQLDGRWARKAHRNRWPS